MAARKDPDAQALGRKRWRGKTAAEKAAHVDMMHAARRAALSPERQSEIAQNAIRARWAKPRKKKGRRAVAGACLFALLRFGGLAHAAEPFQVDGGWWTCPRGYVIHDGRCLDGAELAGLQVIISDLPSAGEGARPSARPSASYAAPAPRYVDSGSYETRSGWFYRPSTSPNFGGTLSRSSTGGTTIISLPWPW